MRIRFFAAPVLDSAAAEEEINRFLSSHRVLKIETHLSESDGGAVWALAVTYLESGSSKAQPSRGRIDYREVLPSHEFVVFARLRRLRKEISERENVPAYSVFTNEQLALMVQQKASTTQALEALHGVGPARIAKYGDAFLAVLAEVGTGKSPGTAE